LKIIDKGNSLPKNWKPRYPKFTVPVFWTEDADEAELQPYEEE